MAEGDKVVINLATGMEDAEQRDGRVPRRDGRTRSGQAGAMFLGDQGGRPARVAGRGSRGRLQGLPAARAAVRAVRRRRRRVAGSARICVDARDLGDAEQVANAKIAGATPALGVDRRGRDGVQLLRRRPAVNTDTHPRGGVMAVDVEIDVELLKSEIKKTYASRLRGAGRRLHLPDRTRLGRRPRLPGGARQRARDGRRVVRRCRQPVAARPARSRASGCSTSAPAPAPTRSSPRRWSASRAASPGST